MQGNQNDWTVNAYFSGTGVTKEERGRSLLNAFHINDTTTPKSNQFFMDGCMKFGWFLGYVFGYGLEQQTREVERRVRELVRQAKKTGKKVTLNCMGHSRGGTASALLAKACAGIDPQYLQINMVLIDPVPGNTLLGRLLDFLGFTRANQTQDLRELPHLKNVLCLYSQQKENPIDQVALVPMVHYYPKGCNVQECVVPGDHCEVASYNTVTWTNPLDKGNIIPFIKIHEFMTDKSIGNTSYDETAASWPTKFAYIQKREEMVCFSMPPNEPITDTVIQEKTKALSFNRTVFIRQGENFFLYQRKTPERLNEPPSWTSSPIDSNLCKEHIRSLDFFTNEASFINQNLPIAVDQMLKARVQPNKKASSFLLYYSEKTDENTLTTIQERCKTDQLPCVWKRYSIRTNTFYYTMIFYDWKKRMWGSGPCIEYQYREVPFWKRLFEDRLDKEDREITGCFKKIKCSDNEPFTLATTENSHVVAMMNENQNATRTIDAELMLNDEAVLCKSYDAIKECPENIIPGTKLTHSSRRIQSNAKGKYINLDHKQLKEENDTQDTSNCQLRITPASRYSTPAWIKRGFAWLLIGTAAVAVLFFTGGLAVVAALLAPYISIPLIALAGALVPLIGLVVSLVWHGIVLPLADSLVIRSPLANEQESLFAKFVHWLQGSGIDYLQSGKHHLSGSGIVDDLNPLRHIIENPKYPMARIYRTSWRTAIKDTFNVIVGNHYDNLATGWGYKGVVDVLLFPLIARRLIGYAYNKKRPRLLRALYGSVGVLLEIPRLVLGVILTALALLVVFPIRALTKNKVKVLETDLKGVQVTICEEGGLPESHEEGELQTQKSIGDLLNNKDHPYKITDITVDKDLDGKKNIYSVGNTFFTIPNEEKNEKVMALNPGGLRR